MRFKMPIEQQMQMATMQDWDTMQETQVRMILLQEIKTLYWVQAQRLQQKAAYVGFDWDATDKVWDKVNEEMEEVKEAESSSNKDRIEEEVGDLLFTIVNLCRFFDISSEDALRKAKRKFTNRFQALEKELKRQGKKLEETNLTEMDEIWNRQKKSVPAQ